MTQYEHRQPGRSIAFVLGGIAAVFLMLSTDQLLSYWGWFVAAILLLLAALFSSMLIRISDGLLQWQFGPGWISKKIETRLINDGEKTRTTFWEGWGIHLTRRGWLYNIAGCDAVLIRLSSGTQFMLGTDQPDELLQAISNAVSTNNTATKTDSRN